MNENYFKKHADTIVILGSVVSSLLWMNGKFNEVDSRFNQVDSRFGEMQVRFNNRFNEVEKDLAVIKAVLVMKNIFPSELTMNVDRREKYNINGSCDKEILQP